MTVNATIRNQEAVAEMLKKLSGPQAEAAYAKAVNDAAFQVRREMQAALRNSFDRVTPWIERSPKVFAATPDKLSAYIAPTLDTRNAPSKGGKVGVDPQHVLQAQEFGGRRADKKSEVVLRRAGILPPGYQTAIPTDPYPGSDDGRGNVRGAFLVQLLSYLQAFGEQGYKANMTGKRKKGIDKGTAKAWGRRYFVAYGRLRGGNRMTRKGDFDQRVTNLAPGIWATDGKYEVAPVLMFVRAPTYRPRISMDAIAAKVDVQAYLDKRVRFRIREAAGV